jgi:hypothetical protein
MLSKTININYNFRLILFFVVLFNFTSFSKSHLLISKTTYNAACVVSTDTHSASDEQILEDIKHNTEGAVLMESFDSEIDFFETEGHQHFLRPLLQYPLYLPFTLAKYNFLAFDLLSPPPRY